MLLQHLKRFCATSQEEEEEKVVEKVTTENNQKEEEESEVVGREVGAGRGDGRGRYSRR